jgi:hypothetical protein
MRKSEAIADWGQHMWDLSAAVAAENQTNLAGDARSTRDRCATYALSPSVRVRVAKLTAVHWVQEECTGRAGRMWRLWAVAAGSRGARDQRQKPALPWRSTSAAATAHRGAGAGRRALAIGAGPHLPCWLSRVPAAGPDPGEADPTAARGVRARCDRYNVGGYIAGGYDGDADRQPYNTTGRCSYAGTDRSMARHRARMRACGRPAGAGNFDSARTTPASESIFVHCL